MIGRHQAADTQAVRSLFESEAGRRFTAAEVVDATVIPWRRVYRALTRLERSGFVEAEWEAGPPPRRRLYYGPVPR